MRHLPNVLCVLRLLLTPFCAYAIIAREFDTAIYLFVVAGVSDFFDGYLARRFNWQSPLGAILDPLADKALTAATFITLGYVHAIPWWLVFLVFGRDLLILTGSAVVAARTNIRSFPPTMLGKLSTVIQLAASGFILGSQADWFPHSIETPLILAIAAGTLVSGIDYIRRGVMLLSEHGQ